MVEAILLIGATSLVPAILHAASIFVVIARLTPTRSRSTVMTPLPPVTVIRPVCGLENFIEPALASTFRLDYPDYEIVFCVAHERDPVVAVIRRLIASHPTVSARLMIGDERISANPKLNNLVKGWNATTREYTMMVDSNVLMARDCLQQALAVWDDDTGLVCSPAQGAAPQGLWAELECAILNTYQARWQLFADSLGLGFAQGKAMLWRRSWLNSHGGLEALAREPAEDAAATKLVRSAGLKVRLMQAPVIQCLGPRTYREVWARQIRWARLRRETFLFAFLPELFAGALLPSLGIACLCAMLDLPVIEGVCWLLVAWYGAEGALAIRAGWHFRPQSILHWILRDLVLPVIWLASWAGDDFVWRGNAMNVAESERTVRSS